MFNHNKHNKITKVLRWCGSDGSTMYIMILFSPLRTRTSFADGANDPLCSRVITFGSSGGFQRDQDAFVIVLQTAGAFPSNWVKSVSHYIERMSEDSQRVQQIQPLPTQE